MVHRWRKVTLSVSHVRACVLLHAVSRAGVGAWPAPCRRAERGLVRGRRRADGLSPDWCFAGAVQTGRAYGPCRGESLPRAGRGVNNAAATANVMGSAGRRSLFPRAK